MTYKRRDVCLNKHRIQPNKCHNCARVVDRNWIRRSNRSRDCARQMSNTWVNYAMPDIIWCWVSEERLAVSRCSVGSVVSEGVNCNGSASRWGSASCWGLGRRWKSRTREEVEVGWFMRAGKRGTETNWVGGLLWHFPVPTLHEYIQYIAFCSSLVFWLLKRFLIDF